MIGWRHLLVGFIAASLCASAFAAKTHVLVVASLHGFHRQNPNFGYERLYDLVRDFRPDIVGVEIRPEDIKAGARYLSNSYPGEMIELRDRYRERAFGFDWLGNQIAGRPIPADWWTKGSRIKELERQSAKDPRMASAEGDRISQAEADLARTATPAALTDGRYYALVHSSRALQRQITEGSRYAALAEFTAQRDRHIDANLIRIVKSHPGKRIVFVMGADHHGYAVDALRREFGNRIDLQLPQ